MSAGVRRPASSWAARPIRRAQPGVAGERREGTREGSGVARLHHEAGLALLDEVRGGPGVGRADEGQPGRGGLQQGDPERVPESGKREDVGARQLGRELARLDEAGPLHVGEGQLARQRAQARPIVALADDREGHRHSGGPRLRHGAQQQIDALRRQQAPDGHHPQHVVGTRRPGSADREEALDVGAVRRLEDRVEPELGQPPRGQSGVADRTVGGAREHRPRERAGRARCPPPTGSCHRSGPAAGRGTCGSRRRRRGRGRRSRR